jgi:hypothetical protein
MVVNWLKWLIAALALSEAGWMLFDGSRALIVGDYVTPKSGRFAGQLGPWARLVSAVGIEPRATPMKCVFVVYGLLWLAAIAAYLLSVRWMWLAMVVAAAGTLWYLPVGTAFSVVQLVLLFFLSK